MIKSLFILQNKDVQCFQSLREDTWTKLLIGNRLTGTDQVSVCSWFRFVRSKVLSGHFLGRLSVTQDAQQADEQQPAEQPGAIHGAEEEVKEEEVEEAAGQEWRSRGSQQVHRRFSLHPPDLLRSYTDSWSPAREERRRGRCGRDMREGVGCVRGRQAAGGRRTNSVSVDADRTMIKKNIWKKNISSHFYDTNT